MLKIRLRRVGAIRQPHYRIVVADARSPRDGRFFETLGHYNPLTNPATINIDIAKYEEWKKKGAQPTEAVVSLVRQYNRANKAATAEGAIQATPDRRTRTASGKGVQPQPQAQAQAETPAPVAEAAPEAATAEASAPAPAAEAEAGTTETGA